jgi:hypothetical protein
VLKSRYLMSLLPPKEESAVLKATTVRITPEQDDRIGRLVEQHSDYTRSAVFTSLMHWVLGEVRAERKRKGVRGDVRTERGLDLLLPNKETLIQVTLRLPMEDMELLRRIAESRGYHVSDATRTLLDWALDAAEDS